MIDQIEDKKFVLCIENKGYEVSLEQWKVYQCLPDEEAENHHEIRVIDEEGEDYIYPADFFSTIFLEASVAKRFILQYENK